MRLISAYLLQSWAATRLVPHVDAGPRRGLQVSILERFNDGSVRQELGQYARLRLARTIGQIERHPGTPMAFQLSSDFVVTTCPISDQIDGIAPLNSSSSFRR